MKLFRKTLIGVAAIICLAVIIILLFYRQESYQLYKVLTFFEKNGISENFRSVKDIFPTTTVPKPEKSNPFFVTSQPYSLIENFEVRDSSVATKAFLDQTLTDALIIIQHDTIRYEYYGNGFKSSDHHIAWSMSKSVISALFGIAIEEGKIKSIEQTVTDYLPDFAGTGYDRVRIKDVLQMSSGVGFNEDYGDFNSDINIMGRYFALGMPMSEFSKKLRRERQPGTFNHYVSIDTQVLGMILTKATGQTITDYMNEKLWSQIGAESVAYWIKDKSEMEFALGGLNATARDFAKIGQLFLDTGKWQGRQIVPREWVLASITPDAPHLMPGKRENAELADGYGFQWWIPEGSEGEFDAQGIYDQFIYIDPNKDLVIVKLSSNYHYKKDKKRVFHNLEMAMFRKIAAQVPH